VYVGLLWGERLSRRGKDSARMQIKDERKTSREEKCGVILIDSLSGMEDQFPTNGNGLVSVSQFRGLSKDHSNLSRGQSLPRFWSRMPAGGGDEKLAGEGTRVDHSLEEGSPQGARPCGINVFKLPKGEPATSTDSGRSKQAQTAMG